MTVSGAGRDPVRCASPAASGPGSGGRQVEVEDTPVSLGPAPQWFSVGCSSLPHGKLLIDVLAHAGLRARLDVGHTGWPATVEALAEGTAERNYVVRIARRLDPAARLVRREPSVGSVRLAALEAARQADLPSPG